GCETCVDECPVEAISMNDDGIAVIDEDECIDCEACVDVCPNDAISMV
ncbi:MAG TPA: 4Fe-4S binding protein, partial [Halobacteria archaeon]|nr:4Fe-4S binding protein [Halobacteria archaeon]